MGLASCGGVICAWQFFAERFDSTCPAEANMKGGGFCAYLREDWCVVQKTASLSLVSLGGS